MAHIKLRVCRYPTRIAGLKPKSKGAVENAVDKHIVPYLGNIPIKDIKPLNIDELFLKLDGKSDSLRRKVLNNLRLIFDSAVDNDIITKSPISQRKKAGGVKAKKKVPLTDEQIKEIVVAIKGNRAELFVLLCLCTGLRREEALGLLWKHIYLNVKHPYLTVCNTVTFDNKGVPTFSPDLKSEAAHRNIPIPPYLADALLRHRDDYKSEFVVPAYRTCEVMTLSAFERLWDLVVGFTWKGAAKRDDIGNVVKDKNGVTIKEEKHYPGLVDFYVAPHLLRHTYITMLCASGLDIKKIQYLAGHESAQMTLDIYTEVRNNTPGEIAPFTNSVFSGLDILNESVQDEKGLMIG